MKAKEYEIKNDSFEADNGKYIAFRPLGEKNFIRGRAKSLGVNFTKERIKERIENKSEQSTSFLKYDKKIRTLIDIVNNPSFSANAGLQKLATKENLKIAAKTYRLMTEKN